MPRLSPSASANARPSAMPRSSVVWWPSISTSPVASIVEVEQPVPRELLDHVGEERQRRAGCCTCPCHPGRARRGSASRWSCARRWHVAVHATAAHHSTTRSPGSHAERPGARERVRAARVRSFRACASRCSTSARSSSICALPASFGQRQLEVDLGGAPVAGLERLLGLGGERARHRALHLDRPLADAPAARAARSAQRVEAQLALRSSLAVVELAAARVGQHLVGLGAAPIDLRRRARPCWRRRPRRGTCPDGTWPRSGETRAGPRRRWRSARPAAACSSRAARADRARSAIAQPTSACWRCCMRAISSSLHGAHQVDADALLAARVTCPWRAPAACRRRPS